MLLPPGALLLRENGALYSEKKYGAFYTEKNLSHHNYHLSEIYRIFGFSLRDVTKLPAKKSPHHYVPVIQVRVQSISVRMSKCSFYKIIVNV